MITYRLVRATDWPEIIRLTNQVFAEEIPMEKSFPLLFNPNNTFSYVAECQKKLIGFIGVLPEELIVKNKSYYGSRIGAVCISNDYQGQGIGRSLFRVMKNEISSEFILVSGQGKLYLQEGCELFGEFKEFTVPSKTTDIELREYDGTLNQLIEMHKLLQREDVYFNKSLIQLQELIRAHSLENLWQGKQKITFGIDQETFKSVVITCTRTDGEQEIIEVLEYGGEKEFLLHTLEAIAAKKSNVRIRVTQNSELCHYFEKQLIGKEVRNAGTCLYKNDQLKNSEIPHTWDLGFL